MEDALLDSFYKNPLCTLISFLLMMVFELLIFIRPLLFFVFLGKNLDLGELAFIFLMIQLVQAFQITPGGIGILEGGTMGILSLIRIGTAQAIGFATFSRIGDIVILFTGLSLATYYGLNLFLENSHRPYVSQR
jgi:uncharacterized protein (TIRG00374 family)